MGGVGDIWSLLSSSEGENVPKNANCVTFSHSIHNTYYVVLLYCTARLFDHCEGKKKRKNTTVAASNPAEGGG